MNRKRQLLFLFLFIISWPRIKKNIIKDMIVGQDMNKKEKKRNGCLCELAATGWSVSTLLSVFFEIWPSSNQQPAPTISYSFLELTAQTFPIFVRQFLRKKIKRLCPQSCGVRRFFFFILRIWAQGKREKEQGMIAQSWELKEKE